MKKRPSKEDRVFSWLPLVDELRNFSEVIIADRDLLIDRSFAAILAPAQ